MNNDTIIFIGLDTHKPFVLVAVLQGHRGGEADHLGRIKSNKSALTKLVPQLQAKYPKAMNERGHTSKIGNRCPLSQNIWCVSR